MNNTDRDEEQLKPCPFCGSEGQVVPIMGTKYWNARCSNIRCLAHNTVDEFECYSRDEAMAAWNKRVAHPTPPTESVEDALKMLFVAAYERAADDIEPLPEKFENYEESIIGEAMIFWQSRVQEAYESIIENRYQPFLEVLAATRPTPPTESVEELKEKAKIQPLTNPVVEMPHYYKFKPEELDTLLRQARQQERERILKYQNRARHNEKDAIVVPVEYVKGENLKSQLQRDSDEGHN